MTRNETEKAMKTQLIRDMSPAQQAKAYGLKNLSEVTSLTGVSLNTLANWAKHKRRLFDVVLLGTLEKKQIRAREENGRKS